MTKGVLFYAVAALVLGACAHASTAARYSPPPGTPMYKTYPISAAFDGTGPPLTEKQHAWIKRILTSKNYGPLRRRLRFANLQDMAVPLVVYVQQSSPGPDERILPHVIGAACNAYFDPLEFGLIAGPGDASCDRNTPKPVE